MHCHTIGFSLSGMHIFLSLYFSQSWIIRTLGLMGRGQPGGNKPAGRKNPDRPQRRTPPTNSAENTLHKPAENTPHKPVENTPHKVRGEYPPPRTAGTPPTRQQVTLGPPQKLPPYTTWKWSATQL